MRLRQEWILGVGGVRVLRAMGIDPAVWHANEGHAAFMMVERLREYIGAGRRPAGGGAPGAGAQRLHHPHAGAGRARRLLGRAARGGGRARCGRTWGSTGTRFFRLGAHPGPARPVPHDRHRHAALAAGVNGVSRRHGQVSRNIWRDLWPGRHWEAVPDRPRDQRRAPGHLDGEPDHGPARRASGRRLGQPARRAAACGTRC